MPNSEQCETIIANVCEEAKQIFKECGAESDFCIQLICDMSIVFGGTNRLKWSIFEGFRPDRAYCTKRFLTLYDADN